MTRRALPLLLLCSVHCGASTRAYDGGSDARTSSECRWVAREPIAVTPRGSPAFRLLEATELPDGALVAARDSIVGTEDHLWLAALRNGAVSLDRVATIARDANVSASLAVDARSNAHFALFDGVANRCLFVRRSVDTPSTETSLDPTMLTMGFTMAGCRDLWLNQTTLSFLSEEVRAVWGTQQLVIDTAGRFVRADRLPMSSAQPVDRTMRSALSATEQVALTVMPTRQPQSFELRAQALDDRAMPRVESALIATTAIAATAPHVVAVNGGLLALWDNAVDTLPPVFSLAVRPLDARAQPTGELVEHSQLGMLSGVAHATSRAGSALVTGRFIDGSRRQLFLVLDARGAIAQGPIDLALPSLATGVVRSRVVATTTGALVITEVNTQSTGNEIVAVPIECQ